MRNIFFLILFSWILIPLAYSGKSPIKFGKVSLDELKMTIYDADTSAQAVVLCDYGLFDQTDISFTRITRIKILKKTGYYLANMTFPPNRKATVKGVTVNLENGIPVESPLKSESIFTEVISGKTTRIRISMPDVRVGSVIDIRFTFYGIPAIWEFQREIPVKHSEIEMSENVYFSIRKNLSGFVPLAINETGHWVAINMPAFKPEPYLSSPKNYITKLTFDIYEVRFGEIYDITTSWESLCDRLYEDPYFGQTLLNDAFLGQAAREINKKTLDDNEKLRLAHDYIKTYKWNKYESLYTTDASLKGSLKENSGNSADINLSLVQLLDKLGFEAKPVVLSTRENGFLSPIEPSFTKLNYVIASVSIKGKRILLDATEENAPYYLLPERDLNLFGHLYDRNNSEVVEFVPDRKEKCSVIYNLVLDENFSLAGTLDFRRFDYAALDFRNKYKSYSGKEAYLEAMLVEYPGLRVSNAEIVNADSLYQPVKDHYEIVLKNMAEEINGEIYIYPALLHRMNSNPFKVEERKYPVDYVHPIEETFSVTIKIPDNFEIKSVPETVKMQLPGNTASFNYQISVIGKTIQFNYKFLISQVVFGEAEYKDLKAFYDEIVAKHSEPVILKSN